MSKHSDKKENMADRFDDYFGGFPPFNISAFLQNRGEGKAELIPVDVYETEEYVVALCDLPGLASKDDVIIDIHEDRKLKIVANRGKLEEFEGKRVLQKERLIGRVDRTVTLPAEVIIDEIEATYKNGVLTVSMPKVKTGIEQKVEVKFEE